jgi:hypothetical protein
MIDPVNDKKLFVKKINIVGSLTKMNVIDNNFLYDLIHDNVIINFISDSLDYI